MIFFAALFLSDLVFMIFYRAFVRYLEPESLFLSWLASPLEFIETIFTNLVLAFTLLTIFCLIRNRWLAALAAAIIYPPISTTVSFAFSTAIASFSMENSYEFPWLRNLLTEALFVFIFIGCIVLATSFIKRTGLALLLGASVGRLLLRSFFIAYYSLTDQEVRYHPSTIGFAFLSGIVFAAAFWFGLRITKEKIPPADGEKPRLSKEFYVGTWMATGVVALISVLIAVIAFLTELWGKEDLPFAFLYLGVVSLLALYGAITFAVLIYRMWSVIQDGHARATPGRAIGFLFIPIFSLYWMFQALPGFAKDFNNFVDRHNINVSHLPPALFTTYCALILCAFIPLFSFITDIIAFIVGIVMMSKICDAVNALPEKTKSSA